MRQMTLMFEPGIGSRNRRLREHLAARVYGAGLVSIAGRLDMAPSKLTEKLAGEDSGGKVRGLTVDELERYIEQTGDVSPIHYLVDKYLQDPAAQQQEALAKLAAVADMLPGLLEQAGINPAMRAAAGRRRG